MARRSRQTAAETESKIEMPLELIQFQRKDATVVTCHWYQMGEDRFHSPEEARAMFYRLWGEKTWPCTIKVLLQGRFSSLETAERPMQEFADLLNQEMWATAIEHQPKG